MPSRNKKTKRHRRRKARNPSYFVQGLIEVASIRGACSEMDFNFLAPSAINQFVKTKVTLPFEERQIKGELSTVDLDGYLKDLQHVIAGLELLEVELEAKECGSILDDDDHGLQNGNGYHVIEGKQHIIAAVELLKVKLETNECRILLNDKDFGDPTREKKLPPIKLDRKGFPLGKVNRNINLNDNLARKSLQVNELDRKQIPPNRVNGKQYPVDRLYGTKFPSEQLKGKRKSPDRLNGNYFPISKLKRNDPRTEVENGENESSRYINRNIIPGVKNKKKHPKEKTDTKVANNKVGSKEFDRELGKRSKVKDLKITKPHIKRSVPQQGKVPTLKELNIANLREFTRLTGGFRGRKRLANPGTARKPWVPKVNRSMCKILYEDHDYENVANDSDHSSDEELEEISRKLRIALLMIADQRKNMLGGINGNDSSCDKRNRDEGSYSRNSLVIIFSGIFSH